jgi:hypothetical protein
MSPSAFLLLALSSIGLPDPSEVVGEMTRVGASDYTINERYFLLPIRVRADRKDEVSKIIINVSTDEGNRWRVAGTVQPDEEGLRFRAEADGVYWFTVQVVGKDNVKEPAEVGKEGAQILKILVDTRKRSISAKTTDTEREYKMPYAD